MLAVSIGNKQSLKNRKTRQDSLWDRIKIEAEEAIKMDRTIAGFLRFAILDQDSLEQAVINRLVDRLHHHEIDKDVLRHTFSEATGRIKNWPELLQADIHATFDRDPTSHRLLDPLLYFKGFHAIQIHRIAHVFWEQGRRDFAYYLQSRSSSVFQTDIHPASQIGSGIFLDHATGLVIGETAIIEDNVSMLHSVTLGGTGKANGDRHPKIRHGVLIGAGAKILGNIEIGACSKVASGSVVLSAVPPHVTVAGIPACVIGRAGCKEPAQSMDHTFIYGDGI
ncbi:MAG: serine O-acetyltransferase [Candidatus Tokpelaia sp. JSC085]|nr:MAG: serine O-acetyltransferase [Candidatus Tokpelaia sp. JSC085]